MAASMINIRQNTTQASSCFSAAYQVATGSTLCLASRRLVSEKNARAPPPSITYHHCAKSAA